MGTVANGDVAMAPLPAVEVLQPKEEAANGLHTGLHNPDDPEAHYSEDHRRERAERQARREELRKSRQRIQELPLNQLWEVPGRYARFILVAKVGRALNTTSSFYSLLLSRSCLSTWCVRRSCLFREPMLTPTY
jgi:hypothetical protein